MHVALAPVSTLIFATTKTKERSRLHTCSHQCESEAPRWTTAATRRPALWTPCPPAVITGNLQLHQLKPKVSPARSSLKVGKLALEIDGLLLWCSVLNGGTAVPGQFRGHVLCAREQTCVLRPARRPQARKGKSNAQLACRCEHMQQTVGGVRHEVGAQQSSTAETSAHANAHWSASNPSILVFGRGIFAAPSIGSSQPSSQVIVGNKHPNPDEKKNTRRPRDTADGTRAEDQQNVDRVREHTHTRTPLTHDVPQ